MPLHKRKPFEALPPPSGLKPEDAVFFLRATDEIFVSYDAYVKQLNRIRANVWSCAYTGKTGLTFEEAATSERESAELLKEVRKIVRNRFVILCLR